MNKREINMLGWLAKIKRWWQGQPSATAESTPPRRLERIVLADGVASTLFEDYAAHRRSPRGNEEIGWILLGLWQNGEAIAMAALPAGAERDAGAAHIRFNSEAQSLASRIVRQKDKRLQMIGVVHTHPGSLRFPSEGDLYGDRLWVSQQRRGEGVFAIGSADVRANEAVVPHVQVLADMRFSWYALGAADEGYRLLPVQVAIGPDLALPLRPVWTVIENYAEPVNRLCRQFAKVQLDIMATNGTLSAKIALAEPNQQLHLLLTEAQARYYWERENELIAIDPNELSLERAVFLILAELAANVREKPVLVES